MTAVFKREFKSYFISPLGYVFLAIFLFFEGLFFSNLYAYGSPNNEIIFPSLSMVVVLVTPVITMRLLSEERRQKIDQALLTAPVTVAGIVLGKFLAAFAVYALAFAPVVVFELVVTLISTPNWLIFLNAWLGAMLIGAALIAIGMLISALTESPIISCILTLITFLLLMLLPSIAGLVGVEWVNKAAAKIAFVNLFTNFTSSIFSITDVVYLLSIIAVFVFLSTRAVERRRWA
ncbi:MAG: ABC transporter permease [Oscillospiraceae bacterium]|nr:ABC transporter permease [Oscillospiraceae bacterium]